MEDRVQVGASLPRPQLCHTPRASHMCVHPAAPTWLCPLPPLSAAPFLGWQHDGTCGDTPEEESCRCPLGPWDFQSHGKGEARAGSSKWGGAVCQGESWRPWSRAVLEVFMDTTPCRWPCTRISSFMPCLWLMCLGEGQWFQTAGCGVLDRTLTSVKSKKKLKYRKLLEWLHYFAEEQNWTIFIRGLI